MIAVSQLWGKDIKLVLLALERIPEGQSYHLQQQQQIGSARFGPLIILVKNSNIRIR